MPTQFLMWIILTILILALVYYRLYKTENGSALASLALLGSAIGFTASLAFSRLSSTYIQESLLNNIIASIWVLCAVLIAITFSTKRKTSELAYVYNSAQHSAGTHSASMTEQPSELPGLIEQSVEALNQEKFDKAVDLLETAITFSEDLGTELKLRTELAFAYQLSGENDLARQQLETGMQVAQELGDSWVHDLSSAVEKLKSNPAVRNL